MRHFKMSCDGHIITWDVTNNTIQNQTTGVMVCEIDREGAEMVFNILLTRGECTEI